MGSCYTELKAYITPLICYNCVALYVDDGIN